MRSREKKWSELPAGSRSSRAKPPNVLAAEWRVNQSWGAKSTNAKTQRRRATEPQMQRERHRGVRCICFVRQFSHLSLSTSSIIAK